MNFPKTFHLRGCLSKTLIQYQFGSTGNLAAANNSVFTINNDRGFSSIAFRLTVPTSGTVTFEGTFDGTNWSSFVMRQIGDDGYIQSTSTTGDYIGSIASVRAFRVRVSSAGSAAGSVIGVASEEACTLEGIENSAAPHKFGFAAVRKGFSFTTTQTAASIWAPATGRKFVVTDLILSVATDGNVKIFDETDAAANWLINADFTVTGVAGSNQFPINLRTPFVSSTTNNNLKITTSTTMTVRGTVFGYEIV